MLVDEALLKKFWSTVTSKTPYLKKSHITLENLYIKYEVLSLNFQNREVKAYEGPITLLPDPL